MAAQTGIRRLYPDGANAAGLTRMTLDPADFDSPLPEQNVHVSFEAPDMGISVGIWDTTTMKEAFGPYPGDEFILVLEGQFSMVDGKGGAVPAQAGQCVAFRNAIPVSWEQEGYLRKAYITYLDPRAPKPEIEDATGGVVTISPGLTLGDDDRLEAAESAQRERILFRNDHGNMEAGIWDTGPLHTDMAPFPWHEFAVIEEGEATITESDGTTHRFKKGDVFFLPAGTECSWDVPKYLRKYFATIDPAKRPGG
jgi:uncharacterized cupin superfamily protein